METEREVEMKMLSGSKEKVVSRKGNFKVLEIIDFKGKRMFYLMTKGGVLLRRFPRFDQAHDALAKIGKNPGASRTKHIVSGRKMRCWYCGGSIKGPRYAALKEGHWYHKRCLEKISKKNPGTNWHVDRADELRRVRSKYKGRSPLMTEQWNYANQRILENELAADASRRLGMNPKVVKIGPKEWHGYAMGQDVYAESRAKLLDKMYSMEHAGMPRTKKRRRRNLGKSLGMPNPTKKKFPLLSIALISGLAYWIWRTNKQA